MSTSTQGQSTLTQQIGQGMSSRLRKPTLVRKTNSNEYANPEIQNKQILQSNASLGVGSRGIISNPQINSNSVQSSSQVGRISQGAATISNDFCDQQLTQQQAPTEQDEGPFSMAATSNTALEQQINQQVHQQKKLQSKLSKLDESFDRTAMQLKGERQIVPGENSTGAEVSLTNQASRSKAPLLNKMTTSQVSSKTQSIIGKGGSNTATNRLQQAKQQAQNQSNSSMSNTFSAKIAGLASTVQSQAQLNPQQQQQHSSQRQVLKDGTPKLSGSLQQKISGIQNTSSMLTGTGSDELQSSNMKPPTSNANSSRGGVHSTMQSSNQHVQQKTQSGLQRPSTKVASANAQNRQETATLQQQRASISTSSSIPMVTAQQIQQQFQSNTNNTNGGRLLSQQTPSQNTSTTSTVSGLRQPTHTSSTDSKSGIQKPSAIGGGLKQLPNSQNVLKSVSTNSQQSSSMDVQSTSITSLATQNTQPSKSSLQLQSISPQPQANQQQQQQQQNNSAQKHTTQTMQQLQKTQNRSNNPFDIAPDAEEILEKAFKISQNFSLAQPQPFAADKSGGKQLQKASQSQLQEQNSNNSHSQQSLKFGYKSRLKTINNGTTQQTQNLKASLSDETQCFSSVQANAVQAIVNNTMNDSASLSPLNQQQIEDSPEITKKFGSTAIGRFARQHQQNPNRGESLNPISQSVQFVNNHISLVQQYQQQKSQTREKAQSTYSTNSNYLQTRCQGQQQLQQDQFSQTQQNLNRSNIFDNFKLEDKIKELQQNLASLPTSFCRPKSKSTYNSNQLHIPQIRTQQNQDDMKKSQEEQQQPQDGSHTIVDNQQIESPYLPTKQFLNDVSHPISLKNHHQTIESNSSSAVKQIPPKVGFRIEKTMTNQDMSQRSISQNEMMMSQDAGIRLSSENDVFLGSTLSTSPDKKSFDNNSQIQQINNCSDGGFNKKQQNQSSMVGNNSAFNLNPFLPLKTANCNNILEDDQIMQGQQYQSTQNYRAIDVSQKQESKLLKTLQDANKDLNDQSNPYEEPKMPNFQNIQTSSQNYNSVPSNLNIQATLTNSTQLNAIIGSSFQPSPALRKKISQTRLGPQLLAGVLQQQSSTFQQHQQQLNQHQLQDTLKNQQRIEEITEEEQEFLLDSTTKEKDMGNKVGDIITTNGAVSSFQGSFTAKAQKLSGGLSTITQNNNNPFNEAIMQTQVDNSNQTQMSSQQAQSHQQQPQNRQRQSLTTIYKKQNKLGASTGSQLPPSSTSTITNQSQSSQQQDRPPKDQQPQVSSQLQQSLTFQQQLALKLEEKQKQQVQHQKTQQPSSLVQIEEQKMSNTNNNNGLNSQQTCLNSNRISLNPCQVTKQQRQEMHLQQTMAQGKLLKIRKKIVREKVDEDDDRMECEFCGRRFMEESYQKHILFCERVFIKRRKEFNAQKQRTMDEEHQKFLETAQTKLSYYQIDQKLNSKWKIYSAQFRAAIESAKTGKTVEGVLDDRIECEYCGRKFATEPAQKHIPICQKKAIDLQNKLKSQKINNQKQALAQRKTISKQNPKKI